MDYQLYWISTITYAIVLGIILFSDIKASKVPSKLEKSYRVMATWVIIFCLQDTLWGLCEAKVIGSDTMFFISSCIFHMSTVVTTFFWLKYVLDFLGENVKNKKIYLILDGIVVLCELAFVIRNCFTITLFDIVDGKYITGPYRPLTFVNQESVYTIIGLTTLVLMLKKDTRHTKNYKTVFVFTLAPILLGLCQLLYPDAPFYSLGYFLGCFVVHMFVVAHDREMYLSEEEKMQRILTLNQELKMKQTEIDEQFATLHSISGAFDYINLVDFDTCCAYRFDEKNAEKTAFDLQNDPHTALNKELVTRIDPTFYDRFWEYTNLSTLDAKMRGKKLVSKEFPLTDGSWISCMYIRIGENENEPIHQVAYAFRDITSDRRRELQVYSALTHLVYSLHIFDLENDTFERLIESDVFKKIVGDEESGQKMANKIMRATAKEEYLDRMLEFVDLSTVSQRMEGKQSLTIEFVGKYHGWTRMTFIPITIEDGQVKRILVTTEIIDSEKNELMNLIYKSSTDEMTRLYNRRTYEDDLDAITESNDMEDLVVMALDVNGLKTVNDTLGHKAGDELIIGASTCINQALVSVGKTYRTGGDEFMAILRCKEEKLSEILEAFDKSMAAWSGHLVGMLSISYGYVMAKDYPDISVRELASEADKKMYEAKSAYYRANGIERRRT